MASPWARDVEEFFPSDEIGLAGGVRSVLGEKEVSCLVLVNFRSLDSERGAELVCRENGSARRFFSRALDDFPVDEPSVSAKLVSLADGEFGGTACDDQVALGCVEACNSHFEPVMVEPFRFSHACSELRSEQC